MKKIELSNGGTTIVDDEDFDRLSRFTWLSDKIGNHTYARRDGRRARRKIKIYMHREILKLSPGKGEVDHVNLNGLDNQKTNLRLCTRSQNIANTAKRNLSKGRPTSIFKGVCWNKNAGKWKAAITKNGKTIHLGYFETEKEAALAYDRGALLHHGEFARLNLKEATCTFPTHRSIRTGSARNITRGRSSRATSSG